MIQLTTVAAEAATAEVMSSLEVAGPIQRVSMFLSLL